MARLGLWSALAVVGIGTVVSGGLIAQSLRPEPGANMVLMALPCFAGPVGCAAAVSMWIAAAYPTRLRPWERGAAWVAGVFALTIFGALALLG